MKEATARIKINKLLEAASWRFFADSKGPANIQLEPSVALTKSALDDLGENFEKASKAYDSTLLPYGESTRTLQIDMMVFDSADQTLRAYEIKRGNGQFDAGKIRSIKRDLIVTQMLLKSYGATANIVPEKAEARIIFYYGRRSIPRPYSLIGSELNEHFGFPVYDLVEEANLYFKVQLYDLLARI